MVKEATFDNVTAYDAWVSLNYDFIRVLKSENILDDWGYPTSARLKRPRIKVTYLDLREF